jgi:hypothetical protein
MIIAPSYLFINYDLCPVPRCTQKVTGHRFSCEFQPLENPESQSGCKHPGRRRSADASPNARVDRDVG